MSGAWLPAVLVFVAVALGTLSLVLVGETARAVIRRRSVARRIATGGLEPTIEAVTAPILQPTATPSTSLQKTLARLPHFRDLTFLLRQAGSTWSPQTYFFAVLGSAVSFGLMLRLLTGSLLGGVVGAIVGSTLPYLVLRRKRTKRLDGFEERFPEAIDLIGRAIRAGHPLSAGIQMVGDEAPEPVSGEFRQVFDQQRFGLPFEDALVSLADRIELVDVRIFVTAVLIQREVGGNLAEILDKISQTIRSRFAIRRQIRTYTAQGRLTGYVLAAMPIVLAITMYFMNREYIMLLFTHPVGKILVVVAVVMQIIGYFWIRKVVNIEI